MCSVQGSIGSPEENPILAPIDSTRSAGKGGGCLSPEEGARRRGLDLQRTSKCSRPYFCTARLSFEAQCLGFMCVRYRVEELTTTFVPACLQAGLVPTFLPHNPGIVSSRSGRCCTRGALLNTSPPYVKCADEPECNESGCKRPAQPYRR